MSIAEYSAAMRGITSIETAKSEALETSRNPNKLSNTDVDDLKRLLKEKG